MEMLKLCSGLFFGVHVPIKQWKFRGHVLHMECWAPDWHDFLNVTWQTVEVRKVPKMVIESELV